MIDRFLKSRTRVLGQHASDPSKTRKKDTASLLDDGWRCQNYANCEKKTLTISCRIYNSILLIDILQIIFDQMYFYTNQI